MPSPSSVSRTGEYAERGDYHRELSPDWEFYPTYLAKLEAVRQYLSSLPAGTRVLDAGCGEGVLVDEFHDRLRLGPSQLRRTRVQHCRALPSAGEGRRARAVLDVLDPLRRPARAGELHASQREASCRRGASRAPSSRVRALQGRLIRTASTAKHPGDRPIGEYLELASRAGFRLLERRGIFPTIPVLTRLIRRQPAKLRPLHRWLTKLVPVPGWCFLNVLRFTRP